MKVAATAGAVTGEKTDVRGHVCFPQSALFPLLSGSYRILCGVRQSVGDTDANDTRCPTPKLRRYEPHRRSASASVEPGETA